MTGLLGVRESVGVKCAQKVVYAAEYCARVGRFLLH